MSFGLQPSIWRLFCQKHDCGSRLHEAAQVRKKARLQRVSKRVQYRLLAFHRSMSSCSPSAIASECKEPPRIPVVLPGPELTYWILGEYRRTLEDSICAAVMVLEFRGDQTARQLPICLSPTARHLQEARA